MAGNEVYRLVMRRGPQPNQVYELTKDISNIGRDITNDIAINDREASRHHLRIIRNQDGFVVEDLGSTNGTFVNGRRIASAMPVKNGDMIALGETVTLGFEAISSVGRPPAGASSPVSASSYQLPSAQSASPSFQPSQSGVAYQPSSYQQQDYYDQQAEYGATGFYDPYQVQEEGGSSRWLILGCFVFLVLGCVCISAVGLIAIDQLNLWCDFPVVSSVVGAFGYCA